MPQSLQQTAGPSKAAKFVQSNPLDPIIRPFSNAGDDEPEALTRLAENANTRLQSSLGQQQPARTERSGPQRAAARPTVPPHQAVVTPHRPDAPAPRTGRDTDEDDESDDDDDWLDDADNDPVLDALRQRRLAELKEAQAKHAANVAKGHGELRTIAQDDFLPECTGSSEFVVVHFFHKDFQRCEIMDHHLKALAPLHSECKFLRIDAEKAPFFVTKLTIRTLPTVMVFQHGKAVDRLTGFDKLNADPSDPDGWKTSRLQDWLASTGAIRPPAAKADRPDAMGGRWSALYRGECSAADDDDF